MSGYTLCMAKKTSTKEPAKKRADRTDPVVIQVYVSEALDQAINEYIANQAAPPTRKAVIVAAITKFLASNGCWPPPKA